MPFDSAGFDEVTQRLIEGRERIAKGWCRGTFHRKRGGVDHYCMLGAIGYTTSGEDGIAREAMHRLCDELPMGRGYVGVPDFNDRRSRTREQAIAIFDAAIAAALVPPNVG